MTTPSDTQSLILSRASTRPGNLALPLPEGLVGAAAKMVVGKMIARGWLEEVEANLRRGEPIWRAGIEVALAAILVLFILFEPMGIYGRWIKIRTYFELFPFYRRDMFRRQRSYLKTERMR